MSQVASGALHPVPAQAAATDAPDACARLYGEPLFALPQDLYIPPDALEVFLETFEGPLDLLLYLIRRQNFNVLDIPMAEVTAQYLAYVEQIRDSHLELAGDYLVMAAMLIDIKSRLLLPVRRTDDDTDEAEDPRAELVRRLLAYERVKWGAAWLDGLPRAGRDFQVSRAWALPDPEPLQPEVVLADLLAAWQALGERARLNAAHQITHEPLSVREHMAHILRRLSADTFLDFNALCLERFQSGAPAAVIVVHFLAVLELVRGAMLEVTQAAPYAPLYVRLPGPPAS